MNETPNTSTSNAPRRQVTRQSMSFESDEMKLKGFRGIATVCREDGENFIVVGRDARGLKNFWKRWSPGFKPDHKKYKKAVVVSGKFLLFFLSLACLPSVYAVPVSLDSKEIRVTRDGMELPRQATRSDETKNLASRHGGLSKLTLFDAAVSNSPKPRSQNSSVSQNLQQERGDVKCQVDRQAFTTKMVKSDTSSSTSSAAPTFKPKGAATKSVNLDDKFGDKLPVSTYENGATRLACTKSVKAPSHPVFLEEKVSPAELFSRLGEVPRHFTIEPPILPGNRFR